MFQGMVNRPPGFAGGQRGVVAAFAAAISEVCRGGLGVGSRLVFRLGCVSRKVVVGERCRSRREQSRSDPYRTQYEDGDRALTAICGNADSPKQWRKKAQDQDHESCTQPNSPASPSCSGKPWQCGKENRKNGHNVHRNVEHDHSGRSKDALQIARLLRHFPATDGRREQALS